MIVLGFSVKRSILKNVLIVLIWFTPYFLYYKVPSGGDILTVARMLMNCIMIYSYRGVLLKRGQNKGTALILIYLLISAYGMAFVSSSTFGKIVRYFEFATFIYATMGFFRRDDKNTFDFFKTLQFMGVVYGLLNLLIPGIKTTPGYGGEYFFIGSEARSVQLLSMLMIASAYVDRIENKKNSIATIVIVITNFVFAVQNESGQGRVMVVVFVMLLLLNSLIAEKLWRVTGPVFCTIAFVAINIITITMSFLNWPIAQYIIVEMLGKDMSLTGRDFIFSSSIEIFMKHPLLGYGYESSIVEDTLSKIFVAFNTAHNAFLQILIDSGLLGTSCLVIIFFIAMNILYNNKDENITCIYFGLLSLLAGGLVNTVLRSSYFWLLLIFALSQNNNSEVDYS